MNCFRKKRKLYWQNINREENPEELNKILKNREIDSIKYEEYCRQNYKEWEWKPTEKVYVYQLVEKIKYMLNILYQYPQNYKYGDKYKLVIKDDI